MHTLPWLVLFISAVSAKGKPDKKALKLVKLQERGINVITTTGE